ncbi:MAG: Nudix family hydrolase [Rhodocyclales bacterium]|nr:Nudix family hydrolase [Rhodocyclales bacterium]
MSAPTKKNVRVAAAVITRPDGSFLLGQRCAETFYPGYWEFPGGKVEAGETPRQALIRELQEELDLETDEAWPWLTREHDYEHAHVKLYFFEVPAWHGELRDRVHSALSWEMPGQVQVGPMLPANGPILKALALPRQMGITQAHAVGVATQLAQLDGALARGLKLVQIREAALPADARESFAQQVVERCHAHGALALVNGDAALARQIGADGLHLPAAQLAACSTRPDFEWVGAACHTRAELEHAARLGLDYALLGHVLPTPSHPDEPALGWDEFSARVAELSIPVLALGGLGPDAMATARAAGAHGIAAIRGIWTPAG